MEPVQPNHSFSTVQTLLDAVIVHTKDRSTTLNLIASENAMSPMTRQMLATDLGNRYGYGPLGAKGFAGTGGIDTIERLATDEICDLFAARYANVQPISGMVANLIAFSSLLQPTDLVLACSTRHGGHYSHTRGGMLDVFGARVEYLPFDAEQYQIDIPAAQIMIRQRKPKLVIVGTSEILFPIPLRELRQACDEVGAQLMYDAAHVAGLIAGGSFQQPLSEGADILTASTNKTLGGPDHGFVACIDESRYRSKIEYGVAPLFVSNTHAHHIAGLAMTLLEMREFGKAYSSAIIGNAQALGKALYRFGVPVIASEHGFTQSHMVLIDAKRSGQEAMRILEHAGIIVSPCPLPTDKQGAESGLRIGTNEMTRYGMGVAEMEIIAELIADVLNDRKTVTSVRKAVREFRSEYQILRYCFASL